MLFLLQFVLCFLEFLKSSFADNEFSSLVGLQFMWKLMPESGGTTHHLAHVPLKESPLTDCGGMCGYLDIQKKLEDSVRLSIECLNYKMLNFHGCENLMWHGKCRGYLQICLW